MDIVIIGAGRIGYTLGERLAGEGHSITLVDSNEERLAYAADNLDVMTCSGSGADFGVLTQAGVGEADLLIAVTDDDAVNMICCLTGKKLGAKNAVARVRTMEYYRQMVFLKDELGLLMVFNPDQATAGEISRILRFPSAEKVDSFAKGRAEMVEFTVGASSPLCGMQLSRFRSKYNVRLLICAVERGGNVIIPGGDFEIHADDALFMVGAPAEITSFFKASGLYKKGVRSVIILGGSRTALYLANMLIPMGMRVKIIERNEEHCDEIKRLIPKADVIFGDGANPKLLEEEGIRDVDAFVALTGSDQNNIIASLFASRYGAKKVITKINENYYLEIAEISTLDSCVMPKSIAADFIVQNVRAINNSRDSGGIESLHEIAGGKAEVLEFTVKAGNDYTGRPLKTLSFKRGTILAAVIRSNICIIPGGDDDVRPGDYVVAVTSNRCVQCFEDLFEAKA